MNTIERNVSCRQVLQVRSLIDGRVCDVLVEKGGRVQAGQLLLRLDSASIEQNIREIEDAVKNWNEILFKREHWEVRSQRAEQQARAKLEGYQKQLQEKKNELMRRQIHALLTGTVTDIVPVGTEVQEETVVAHIGDDSMLKMEVSSEDVASFGWDWLNTGDRIPLAFNEINLVCYGEIVKKTDGITILIPNEKYQIAPGMTARFQVPLQPVKESPVMAEKKQVPKDRKVQTEIKKIEWEISAGLSYSNPGQYRDRAEGLDALHEQYAGNAGIDYTVSGELEKNILLVPFQALVNYPLSGKWYLQAGLEFGYGNDSPTKTYLLDWGTPTETIRVDLSSKLTYWMPFVGLEARPGKFGIYANLGYGFLSFSHQKDYESSMASFWFRQSDSISANGSGFGLVAGGKYFIAIGKKMDLLIKMELSHLTIGNLKGSRDTLQSSSTGETFSESVNGTIYSFETNPYGLGWFNYWELFESAPSGSDFRNVGEMKLNLLCIRLMVGLIF